jgi:hypothetical protein
MAITIDTNTATALGTVTAGAGPEGQRAARPGDPAPSPGNRVTAQGRLALAEDGETVLFVPTDPAELEAVIAADEA